MPRTDWRHLLTSAGVAFVEAGGDNINVACPWCGSSDPSQHLAISLIGRGWRCLRNPQQHRGRSYLWLAVKLFRCSEAHARDLLGMEATFLPDQDTFAETWRKQLGVADATPSVTKLSLPREVRPMSDAKLVRPFWTYLTDQRGYTEEQARWLVRSYDLHYAITGRYRWRVVIPIVDDRRKLMTWTARSIKRDAEIRYDTLKRTEAVRPPGDLLLGLPLLWEAPKARCLVVCEGPFDAMTVSCLGHEVGVWGTCLFGVDVSEAQADLLEELSSRFERMRLLIDPDKALSVLSLRTRLPPRCRAAQLLPGVKDPGDLTKVPRGLEFVEALA